MIPAARRLLLAPFALLGACTAGWSGGSTHPAPVPASRPRLAATVPEVHRVVDVATGQALSLAALAERASMADVVFFGEQHGDSETHFVEYALLDAISRRRGNIVVSLEMFERDVQPHLDGYLAGRILEAEFLAGSRPWERYATDYRPVVLLARAHGMPVMASNIPRPLASAVARGGLAALDTLPPDRRTALVAGRIDCPRDAYFTRFAEQMGGHGPQGADAALMTQRYYEAQCVKDETMAESIAGALTGSAGRLVIHYNGAFHSDFGLGTVSRVDRRVPGLRRMIVTAVPVADPSLGSVESHRGRADYVIFTRATRR